MCSRNPVAIVALLITLKKGQRNTKTPFSYVILTSRTNLDLFHVTDRT